MSLIFFKQTFEVLKISIPNIEIQTVNFQISSNILRHDRSHKECDKINVEFQYQSYRFADCDSYD